MGRPVIASSPRIIFRSRLPPVFIQPMATDDVVSAVVRIAMGSPVNGTVEVGGRTVSS
jgi:hypothetical protein